MVCRAQPTDNLDVHGICIHVLPEVMRSRWLQRELEGLTVAVK